MQAVLLAAGQSSRFYPLNSSHKSLTVLMGKSLIEHTILSVKKAGIEDIVLVCSKKDDFEKVIGDGQQLGVRVTYCIQDQPRGMGDALLKAESYLTSDFFVLSPHRADFAHYHEQMLQKKKEGADVVLVAQVEQDLRQYGAITIDGDRVTDLIEKPEHRVEQGYRLLSTYLFSPSFLQRLKETPDSHYQLEQAIADHCKASDVRAIIIDQESFSLKYPWHLFGMKDYLLTSCEKYISPHAQIAPSAIISGDVVIEDGARILEHAVIKGPCYIGTSALVGDFAVVRSGTVIENEATVGVYTEVKNSIIGVGSHIHSGYIGDSIIGQHCRIGAGICISNVRLDRQEVHVLIKGEKVNSQRKNLGVIIGDNTKIGVQVCTMPGVIVGRNSVIGPSSTVMENVEDNCTFYTKHQTVIKR